MNGSKEEQKYSEDGVCLECEQELHPDRKICPECKQELHPEDCFCPRCGAAAVSSKGNGKVHGVRFSYVGLIGLAAIGVGLLFIALIFVTIFRI